MTQLQITHIPLSNLSPSPTNPRKYFDQIDIDELAQSISTNGVLQPILVRLLKKDKYEIVAGERRYRASLLPIANQKTIPCIIRELTDDQVMEMQIIENLQRKDISPMEEAIGFQQLTASGKMDVTGIADRVGKTAKYVAQRIRLTMLIEPIQKIVHQGRLTIKDAMIVSGLSTANQKDLHENTMQGDREMIHVNNWYLQNFHGELTEAPFDITDPLLIKKMGPCTSCQFNTANHVLLFSSGQKATCQNLGCFKQKANLSFDRELKKAADDPTVVLISGVYSFHGEDKNLAELCKKHSALTYNQYNVVEAPEVPNQEDFEVDPDDLDIGDTLKEAQDLAKQNFQRELDAFERRNSIFQKKLNSGKLIRAYVLGGSDKGRYTYVELQKEKGKALTSTSGKNGSQDHSASDIKDEIERIKARHKRSIELDDSKIWEGVRPLLDPGKVVRHPRGGDGEALTELEIEAFKAAVEDKIDWHKKDAFRKLFKDPAWTDIPRMIRFFYTDVLPPGPINGKMSGHSLMMKKIAEHFWPDEVAEICTRQKEVAERRSANVDKRMKALQSKLKEIKPAAGSAKKQTKKAAVR